MLSAADRLFEKLGYSKIQDDLSCIIYNKKSADDNYENVKIIICSDCKSIGLYGAYRTKGIYNHYKIIDELEDIAIHEKIEEIKQKYN